MILLTRQVTLRWAAVSLKGKAEVEVVPIRMAASGS
jgi:hypothetical protein